MGFGPSVKTRHSNRVRNPQQFPNPVFPYYALRPLHRAESREVLNLGKRNRMRLGWNFGQRLHAEFAAGPGQRAAPLLLPELAYGGGDSFKQAVSLHSAFVFNAFNVFILNLAECHGQRISFRLLFAPE
jgi:hypothetical protein